MNNTKPNNNKVYLKPNLAKIRLKLTKKNIKAIIVFPATNRHTHIPTYTAKHTNSQQSR